MEEEDSSQYMLDGNDAAQGVTENSDLDDIAHGATGILSTLICDKSNELITSMCELQIADREKIADKQFVEFAKNEIRNQRKRYEWREQLKIDQSKFAGLEEQYRAISLQLQQTPILEIATETFVQQSKLVVDIQLLHEKITFAHNQIKLLENEKNDGYKLMISNYDKYRDMARAIYEKLQEENQEFE